MGVSLSKYQQAVINAVKDTDDCLAINAVAGCHAGGQGILMFDGSIKPVEEISIGDLVMGVDGPRKVLELYSGERDMYRVSPQKGEFFDITDNHILALSWKRGEKVFYEEISLTEYILRGGNTHKKLYRASIVEFTRKKTPIIDPYFLGILLGDGGGFPKRRSLGVTNVDQEIIDEVYRVAKEFSLEVKKRSHAGRCPTYYMIGKSGKKNPIKNLLWDLGLTTNEKHIPFSIKTGSLETRRSVLAGLLDTDGSYTGKGFDFISKHRQLSEDVVFVARSLGKAAYFSECEKVCVKPNGERIFGVYYRVSLSGDFTDLPIKVRRKIPKERRQIKSVLRTGIKSVVPLGRQKYYGFKVDKDHLYLLDDFTVTHNSGKTFTLLECMKHINTYNAIFIAFNKSIADELAAKVPANFAARTFHSICFEAWRNFCDGSRLKVDEDKVWSIIWKLFEEDDVKTYGYFIKQLVGLAKNMGVGTDLVPDTLETWNEIICHHDLQMPSSRGDITLAILYARKVLVESSKAKYVIDFDDMLYLPLLYGANFRRYDIIFIDEAQDLSTIQHALLEAMLSVNGRLIAVGDPHQAIYGFRGADSESMNKLSENFDCVELPLSVTYRCDKAIVEHAKQWVPHIEPRKYAGDGIVEELTEYSVNTFDDGDVIICRNSAPLISAAYSFLRRGRRVRMLGRDIGDGLIILIDKMRTEDIDELEVKLEKWYIREMEKAQKRRNEPLMISIEDRYQCIKIFIDNLPEPYRTVDDLCYEIARMFKETDEHMLTLCTGHKSKGLEWDHVFWLERGLIPSRYATKDWMLRQENNLAYVITTRARHHLSFISQGGMNYNEKYDGKYEDDLGDGDGGSG